MLTAKEASKAILMACLIEVLSCSRPLSTRFVAEALTLRLVDGGVIDGLRTSRVQFYSVSGEST